MPGPDLDAQVTFLFVADLESSAAFYGGVLGLEQVRDQGSCVIYRVAADAYLGICDHRPVAAGGVIVTLVAEDVDGWAERLRRAGVAVDGPRDSERFGIRHFFLTDPDGHVVEVQRFDDPL